MWFSEPENHREHNNLPLPAGETGLPSESHSQTVKQLCHREASSSSHPQPVVGSPVASVWEGSP